MPVILNSFIFCCFFFLIPYSALAEDVNDPLEDFNRVIFEFNDFVDIYLFEPIARSYEDYMPKPIKNGIGNFFENINYPIYLLSDIIQLKFDQATTHTGRFLINSTIGLLGTMDIAKDMGLEVHKEDFGTALGYWGVPSGPYLVLPLLGPSNVRDLFGSVADNFAYPPTYLKTVIDHDQTRLAIYWGLRTTEAIDLRARLLPATDTGRKGSLDYYIFLRSSFHQKRESLIHDGKNLDEYEDDENIDWGNEDNWE